MANMNIDPTLDLAQGILYLTLLIGLCQLFYHVVRFFYRLLRKLFGKEVVPGTANSSYWEVAWLHRALTAYLVPFFRYALAIIYGGAVIVVVTQHYSVFRRKSNDFDHFLVSFANSLALQLLAVGIAALLWCYANGEMRRLIPWSLFVIGLDVIAETGFQFVRYPVLHWLQAADFLMTGVVLLVIPWVGFVIFNYLGKSGTVVLGSD